MTEASVKQTGLFRWTEVEALLKDHLERRANSGYHLWGLLILFLWMNQWKIQPSLPPPEYKIHAPSVEVPSLT